MPKRMPLSCENCRQRKIRCLGSGVPCDTCRKRGVSSTCQFKRDVDQKSRPDNHDFLIQRISELENLLIQNIDLTNSIRTSHNTLRSPVSQNPAPSLEEFEPSAIYSDDHCLEQGLNRPQSHAAGSIVTSASGHVKYVPHNTSASADLFHLFQSPLQSESPSGISLFSEVSPNKQYFLDMLPPFRQCDELIAVFLDVFSPLFHILHDPTFQENYAEFKKAPQNSPIAFIGVVFVALGLAVTALDRDSPLLPDLGREASPAANAKSLAEKYRQAAMKCLAADNFMWQHNMHTLQCLILLIYAINHVQGPAWALLGTTLNIAIAIGCHIDPRLFNLPPIESEERRRAWAALMMLYTIQNTCLGNLATLHVGNNVQLPADVEDDEIMSNMLQGSNANNNHMSPGQGSPTKMSYILFKFRLYSLASDICRLMSTGFTSPGEIQSLDYRIQAQKKAHEDHFSAHINLPVYHQAHSFILSNYVNHLDLLLHRSCFFLTEGISDEIISLSYERCEQAALAILSNYENLHLRPEFQRYSWYIYGLGSFHAFLAISTLMVLLGKSNHPLTPEPIMLQAMQNCLQIFHDASPYSEMCSRVCSMLDPLATNDLFHTASFPAFSSSVSELESSACTEINNASMAINSKHETDGLDPIWSLPERFEEIVSKIPVEQWLSPAGFPWTDALQI